MKRVISIAVVIVASLLLWPGSAQAQNNCSNGSLKGKYGYTEVGAPWNVAGLLTFDGAGNVSNDFNIVFTDGSVTTGSETWTYQVSPDCRFVMRNTSGDGYFGVLVLNRSELKWVIGTSGLSQREKHIYCAFKCAREQGASLTSLPPVATYCSRCSPSASTISDGFG